jgi:uncharacterized alpha/beta hydrolase family protein
MMKKYTFSIIYRTASFLVLTVIFAQVSLAQNAVKSTGQTAKEPVTKTEVKSSDQLKQVPRVALSGATDTTAIKGKSTNLLIYNTATAGAGQNKVSPGYYHNVGTTEKPNWKKVEATVSDAVKDEKE